MNELINLFLQSADMVTEGHQAEITKKAAQALANFVKSTETTIDDVLVKNVVIPNLDLFVVEFKAAMAA